MNTLMLNRRTTPRPGRVVHYESGIDPGGDRAPNLLDYVAVKALLEAGLAGDCQALLELNSEMEARDDRLRIVAWTRRASLTALEWEIDPVESPDREADNTLADEAANYIRSELERLTTFDCLLRKMATAIGPNLSVTEVEWGDGRNAGRVQAFHPVGHQRLRIDYSQSLDVRIIPDASGNPVQQPYAKFVTHVPDDVGDRIFSNTITRAQALLWVTKKLAIMDWSTFCSIFGMPARVATFGPRTTRAQKTEAIAALAAMGSKAYMLLPEDMKYEMKEVARQANPYEAIVQWVERSQAIGYLGQNLTTDTTGSGGLGGAGAAQVHQDTKRLITEEDANAEARTLREQLFTPMLRFRFPNRWQSMPVPYFRRIWRDDTTRDVKAQMIRTATQDLGLKVSRSWAHRELGIPEAEEGDATIERFEPTALPMGSTGF